MFRIGESSRLSRLSMRMLRHYDTPELLVPALLNELTKCECSIQEALEDQRRQLQAVRHLARSVAVGDDAVSLVL